MPANASPEERLQQIYEMLREMVQSSSDGIEPDESGSPALPLPLDVGGRMSATDLLSWWFRPPTAAEGAWNQYFGEPEGSSARAISKPGQAAKANPSTAADRKADSQAALRVLVDWPNDDLANEDADTAIEVFYGFLHAFGRKDIASAMQFIAEDYHVFEDDREVDGGDLSTLLESLIESLHGFEFAVSLAMIPEPLRHPYGIVIYVEIQIDARRAQDGAKRNLLERRLVLLQKQADFSWKIAAFSKPRN